MKHSFCQDDFLFVASLRSEYPLKMLFNAETYLTQSTECEKDKDLYRILSIAYEACSPAFEYLFEYYKKNYISSDRFQPYRFFLAAYAAEDGRLDVLKLLCNYNIEDNLAHIIGTAVTKSKSVECVMYLLEQGFPYDYDEVFTFFREAAY